MNKRFLIAVNICIWLMSAAAFSSDKLSNEQISSLFNQANESFRQANLANDASQQQKLYEKAILSFEKIINDGKVSNAKLYCNLANTYLLKGDVGRAILNYRRAEKLDSSDNNIRKNLAFARSKRTDQIKLQTEKQVMQTLFFIITSVCFAIVCIILTMMIWFGRAAWKTAILILSAILTVLFLASFTIDVIKQMNQIDGVITAAEVVARQGDGVNYPESFKLPLHAGTEFNLIEQRPGWLHIKLSNSSDGWIPDNSAEMIQPPSKS